MKSSRNPTPQRSRPHQNNNHFRQSTSNNEFLFNKTSLLSSALEKLKGKTKSSAPKRVNQQPIPLPNQNPSKKIKGQSQAAKPTLSYTPLQKDLFNFYTINKVSLKNFESVPQPKLDIGAIVMAAICDRGIGGKYLVTNLFRNKKGFIDYTDIPLNKKSQQASIQALQAYQSPGDFIIGTLIKPRSAGKIQISLSEIEQINEKLLRVGQVLVGQIRSKQQLGCHLIIKGLKKFKAYLPKSFINEDSFNNLSQNKQVITIIKEIDESKHLVKVTLITQQQIAFNLRGIEQQQMSKLQIEHYVFPGTLVNTKVVKKLNNGLMVKFLKIFIGFIHADHLNRPLESYSHEEKLLTRVIYQCNNPPMIFLSERHRSLKIYEPSRSIYETVKKPQQLRQIQKSYLSPQDQFYAHPIHLHSQIQNLNKFWIKQNNYFEGYQIMSSKKIGIKVGDIGKSIPFTNFKIYGQGQGKFRVMCLDLWNKVIKICYDNKIIQSKNLLYNIDNINQNQKYCGFISNINANGIVVQFCNNIKGILSQRQLQNNQIDINQTHIGKAIEVYIINNKKNYLGLTITPPQLRKITNKNKIQIKEINEKDSTQIGVIQSISSKSIHPIYIKIKNKLIKINIFDGIKPPSIQDLPIITNLQSHYQVGSRIQVFFKKGKYYLYPPEQLSDKNLRFCRIIKIHGNSLRVQTRQNEFKNCHICDITDLISPHPLHQYQVGDYTIGRIIGQKDITLRTSLIINGLPQNMKDVVQHYTNDQKKGDFRARIEAVGPSALKLETIAFGYIKNYSDKGCFISLARNFDVRVERSELSDHYLPNPEHIFTLNKLVLLRLISVKTKNGDTSKYQVDASLRESVVKFGYPLNDQILQTGVGLTVYGIVTGYVKGKALVRLQSSKFTGIIALKDVEQAQEQQTLEKVLPIGKRLTCKIVEYSRDGEKRLIRLSTLSKVFKKYDGLQTTFDIDERIVQLWSNFQNLSAIEAPLREENMELQQQNEEQEYERLKKLLVENDILVDNQPQNQNQEQQQQEEQDENIEQEEEQGQQEQVQGLDEEDQQQEMDVQEQDKTNNKSNLQKKVAQFQAMPHPKQFYQSLVLANPTPQSYLLYISSLLPTATPQQIRSQFLRAINNLTSISDKDNMWISWINTEQLLGDFTGTVKKAVQANVGQVVYFRILQILTEQQNWPIAIEFGKKMLKKFNRDPRAYIAFLKMTNQYSRSGHELQESLNVKQIMKRANQCLKVNDVIQIQINHAKSLFEWKESQQGRNILEQLITKYPKRVDLWCVYIDQETKSNNIDKARNLMERALSIGLKKKLTITLLKKYLALEKAHGTQESINKIIQRAKSMAEDYQNLNNEDQQIEDIE